MNKVRLGYIPTRRDIFSKEDAIKYKELILEKLKVGILILLILKISMKKVYYLMIMI